MHDWIKERLPGSDADPQILAAVAALTGHASPCSQYFRVEPYAEELDGKPQTDESEKFTREETRGVSIRNEGTALRVVLMQKDEAPHIPGASSEGPDLYIERQGGKWIVLLHPCGCDPVVSLTITDEGKVIVADETPVPGALILMEADL